MVVRVQLARRHHRRRRGALRLAPPDRGQEATGGRARRSPPASGGYVAAIAADHIVGRGNTLTGSIGVIMEYPDFTKVMDRLEIGLETVRSSELKAEPSPFRPTNPEARARDEALVAESYRWFRGLVGERRGLEGARLDAVANGGVFTGRLARKRADRRNRRRAPSARLARNQRHHPRRLAVRDWRVEHDRTLAGRFLGRITSSGGISGKYRSRLPPSSIPSDHNSCHYDRGRDTLQAMPPPEAGAPRHQGVAMIKVRTHSKDRRGEPAPLPKGRRAHRRYSVRRDHRRHGGGASGRAARLRRLLGQEARGAAGPQSADRQFGDGGESTSPFFKTGKLLRDRLNGG